MIYDVISYVRYTEKNSFVNVLFLEKCGTIHMVY